LQRILPLEGNDGRGLGSSSNERSMILLSGTATGLLPSILVYKSLSALRVMVDQILDGARLVVGNVEVVEFG